MKWLIGLLLFGGFGAANAASSFTYWPSPIKAYQCIGYSTAKCTGFEASLATEWVDYVQLKVTLTKPLQFHVTIMAHSQVYQAYNQPADMSSPFVVAATDGSGLTATVTIVYAATLHCTRPGHCANRYLPIAGSVTLP